ncbi:MAG: FMN-binding protein [candidate division KSB1 bacterium]|jgi:uncharacterized protein with FMN-binding domain|nr:FMN-binding protein [candidate division KSB1 bacterium]
MTKEYILNHKIQKALKFIHLVFVAGCTGGVMAALALMSARAGLGSGTNPLPLDLGVYRIINLVVNYSFFGILFTAVIYGLFTKWGFFLHRWIIVKWAAIVLLFGFVWVWLGPAIDGMVAISDGGFSIPGAMEEYSDYAENGVRYLIIEAGVFIALIWLSIFKPWGARRTKRRINRKVQIVLVSIVVMIFIAMSVMMSLSLDYYRNLEIADRTASGLQDGIYSGSAVVAGILYEADVEVKDERIVDVVFTENRESSYARYAEGVVPRILEKQTPNVDAITAATTTSKALMKAVEDALEGNSN